MNKPGVYICKGCEIAAAIDTEQLAKVARTECKAAVVQVHDVLCRPDGVAAIRKDLSEGTVDSAVIAACSPRVKTEAFSFDPRAVVERVNLREHVAWCQKPGEEDTQMMAEDYLRMGVVKAQKSEPLEPVSDPISKAIMVVGGGMAGLTATLEAAAAGYEVVLVEKAPQLGGFASTMKKRFPSAPPYTELSVDGIQEKIRNTAYHPKIRVFTSAKILRTEGQPGMFDATVQAGDNTTTFRVGAIIMATGWKPYDAGKLAHLGYGRSPNVVTNFEFEQAASAESVIRRADGRTVEDIIFVQCAGSRDKDHLPYCSSVCCLATLKHTRYVRERNPNARVYVVYKDIRTPAQHERFYAAVQGDPLAFFVKGEVAGVGTTADGRLTVEVHNSLLGENVAMQADMIVLATGMVPNAADGVAIRALHDAEANLKRAESDTQRAELTRQIEALKSYEGTEILNLAYRQGPDLPSLRYGFPDSHFICFPYETMRTGIYAAGAVRAPMDLGRTEQDALGAAMKAIQSVELAARGQAVHPRALDLSFPSFFLQRCTQCKRCTEECPFGTLDEDEKGTPKPNPYRCRRCGVCMGACPERIISFKNYSVDMIASMIKAVEVPEEEEEKPRALIFMCENDAYPALDIAGMKRLQYDPSVRVIPLRCLGSMNIVWIADALSRGIDGIMLVGCKYGDDYQCHFAKGSELASRRLSNVKETLQRLQLESERLNLTQLAINESDKLPELINSFMEQLRELGPNPYKGF